MLLGLAREFVLSPVKSWKMRCIWITGDPRVHSHARKGPLRCGCEACRRSPMSTRLTSALAENLRALSTEIDKNLHEGVLIDEHGGRRQVMCLSCGEKP